MHGREFGVQGMTRMSRFFLLPFFKPITLLPVLLLWLYKAHASTTEFFPCTSTMPCCSLPRPCSFPGKEYGSNWHEQVKVEEYLNVAEMLHSSSFKLYARYVFPITFQQCPAAYVVLFLSVTARDRTHIHPFMSSPSSAPLPCSRLSPPLDHPPANFPFHHLSPAHFRYSSSGTRMYQIVSTSRLFDLFHPSRCQRGLVGGNVRKRGWGECGGVG